MRWGTRGIALLLMLVFWTSAAHAATPEYFPFPTGYKVTGGVTADASGNIWFGAAAPKGANPQDVASLARLVPSQSTPGTSNGLTFYPTPNPPAPSCCATQIRSVAYSANQDRVYYVRSDGVVGYANPAGVAPETTNGFVFTALPIPLSLGDIAAAPNGGAWFTEYASSNVAPNYYGGRVAFWNGGAVVEGPNIAIQNGNTTLNSLRYDAKPDGIAVDAAGLPWFVEGDPGNPGYRIATYSGAGDNYQEYLAEPCAPTPTCSGTYTGTGLRDLTIAPDGSIWFTNELKKSFGRFDPATHEIKQFTLGSVDPALANGIPRAITTAPDGTIWMAVYESFFASTPGNAIVKIVPSKEPTATPFKLPGDRPPGAVGADHAGNIWFGLALPSAPYMVGRLAGVIGTSPPLPGPTPAPTPTPPGTPAPVVLKPASVGTARLTPPQVGNGVINANQICVGPPQDKCSVVYLVKEHEYVTGFPNTRANSSAKKKKAKPKPRVLGTKTVTISGGQSRKVTITLNALGKRILKKNKKLKVDFTATQKLANGKTKRVLKKTLTFRKR